VPHGCEDTEDFNAFRFRILATPESKTLFSWKSVLPRASSPRPKQLSKPFLVVSCAFFVFASHRNPSASNRSILSLLSNDFL
jgi:hypothetical protein